MKVRKLYRVQGGKFPNRSKNLIIVNKDHTISCPNRIIHIGNTNHMIQFLLKRLGIKEIADLTDVVAREANVNVIEMIVPYWLPYLLEIYAVNEYKNRSKEYPKLVDVTIPRTSISNFKELE